MTFRASACCECEFCSPEAAPPYIYVSFSNIENDIECICQNAGQSVFGNLGSQSFKRIANLESMNKGYLLKRFSDWGPGDLYFKHIALTQEKTLNLYGPADEWPDEIVHDYSGPAISMRYDDLGCDDGEAFAGCPITFLTLDVWIRTHRSTGTYGTPDFNHRGQLLDVPEVGRISIHPNRQYAYRGSDFAEWRQEFWRILVSLGDDKEDPHRHFFHLWDLDNHLFDEAICSRSISAIRSAEYSDEGNGPDRIGPQVTLYEDRGDLNPYHWLAMGRNKTPRNAAKDIDWSALAENHRVTGSTSDAGRNDGQPHVFIYNEEATNNTPGTTYKLGDTIPNGGICETSNRLQVPGDHTNWPAPVALHFPFSQSGTATVLPLYRPESLTVTINDDGENCAGCYAWPGSKYAQVTGWTAPGTYTATITTEKVGGNCNIFRYQTPDFDWGTVNLFTNYMCSSAASPSSETVNGPLVLDMIFSETSTYNGTLWNCKEATGPSNIARKVFVLTVGSKSSRHETYQWKIDGNYFGSDGMPAITATSCGSATDKIIRLGYTFKLEIKEID